MDNRKPSQFYQHLKNYTLLAHFYLPRFYHNFTLTLWRNRLPARIRRILTAVDSDPEMLMRQAHLIAEEFGEDYQRTARITMVIDL